MLKLPREPRIEEKRAEIEKIFASGLVLWKDGNLRVPFVESSECLDKALSFARRCGQLRGGLENIETLLQKEQAGLVALKHTQFQGERASRLLLLSNDGSERFYRNCESLLIRYRNRILGCKINLTGASFGQKFFGKDAVVKVVMVSKKDFVGRVLIALAESGNEQRHFEE